MYSTYIYSYRILIPDEEGDMDVHDRGMLYYRLLKHNVQEARRVVCGQHKVVASKNTIIPRVSHKSCFGLARESIFYIFTINKHLVFCLVGPKCNSNM